MDNGSKRYRNAVSNTGLRVAAWAIDLTWKKWLELCEGLTHTHDEQQCEIREVDRWPVKRVRARQDSPPGFRNTFSDCSNTYTSPLSTTAPLLPNSFIPTQPPSPFTPYLSDSQPGQEQQEAELPWIAYINSLRAVIPHTLDPWLEVKAMQTVCRMD
jgi:hypothetical protein